MKVPRGVTARDIIRALQDDGFVNIRTRGSHRRFRHPDGRAATVSCHKESDVLPTGTLRSIIALQARWNEDDLRRLDLME